jgi:tetratricopeptide (TPR) repeat protein
LRNVRPEFALWSNQANGSAEVLALADLDLTVKSKSKSKSESKSKSKGENEPALELRWRRYGEALAAVKAYPFAVQAMQRSLAIQSRSVESLIGLGRVFLAEGDVLSAQDQLRLARDAAVGDALQSARISAWMAAATRTAQPAQAVETLTPLVERYPRDLRLRFELGRAQMDLLRNREASTQFKSMLDVDPLDATAHYNLMLCYQRLNLLSEARREEVVYRLMAPETESTLGTESVPTRAIEARPLHVHELEAPR